MAGNYRRWTVEELADRRITDLKANGLRPCECQLCGEMIEETVYRVSLTQKADGCLDIYVDKDCYWELRERCSVDPFASTFGA